MHACRSTLEDPTSSSSFTYEVYNCGQPRTIHLNVLVDWNQDGDWNDNMACVLGTPCSYEWAVKNATVTILPGCNLLTTPAFLSGPFVRNNLWLRISISDQPVNDDFPWAGSFTTVNDHLPGGETEDYQVDTKITTALRSTTWGSIKSLYR